MYYRLIKLFNFFAFFNVATINGHREIVALLISHKADVNLKSEYGWTPLHFGR